MLKRKWLFIFRHYDFLMVDLAAFLLGYLLSMLFRQSLHLYLNNENYFFAYGATAVCSFILAELISENLNGVVSRGLVKETKSVVIQMTLTWAMFLSFLFLMHIIFGLSRVFTVASYLICILFLLVFRTGWKMICKYTRASETILPKLLIVCDAEKAQKVLDRLLPGTLQNEYGISGLIVNGMDLDYNDWYPHETGLENIGKWIRERQVQEAYVELSNPAEEKEIIEKLLNAGIVVHRSLGDSDLQYSRQNIDSLGRNSVITITGSTKALVSRADRVWQQIRRKASRE